MRRPKSAAKPFLTAFAIYWLPILLYCLFIFFLSGRPVPERLRLFTYSDKLIHFFIYAGLGALIFRALRNLPAGSRSPVRTLVFSMLLAGLYGLSDEIHQAYVPFRDAEVGDLLADILGGGIGPLAYYLFVSAVRQAAGRYSWIDKLDTIL